MFQESPATSSTAEAMSVLSVTQQPPEDTINDKTARFDLQDIPSDSKAIGQLRQKSTKTVATQTSQVFFMIGCQRSGSNWLRTMLGEREDLIAPHPPHIMRDFMPRLGRYGDLSVQGNLRVCFCRMLHSNDT